MGKIGDSTRSESALVIRYPEVGVESLRALEEQLLALSSSDEPWRWRWVILIAHDALQCFLVAATKGGDQLGASDERYRERWFDNYSRGIPDTPGDRLASTSLLLERAKNLRGFVDSKPLTLDTHAESEINRLISLRHELTHPKALTRIVEVSGIPKIVETTLGVIDFLAIKSMHVYRTDTESADYLQIRQSLHRAIAPFLNDGER